MVYWVVLGGGEDEDATGDGVGRGWVGQGMGWG